MDLILDLLAIVSCWSRSNLSEIALALVGCLLVLFGADFKGWVEQRLGSIAGAAGGVENEEHVRHGAGWHGRGGYCATHLTSLATPLASLAPRVCKLRCC